MTLPVKSSLSYNLTVPSTKKKHKFRPFYVREQKELLLAQQSEDISVMVSTLKNVILSCVENIDVDSLALFDIEYIFTQIRAKSTGEIVEILMGCDYESCVDNPKAKIKVPIDLTKLEVTTPEGHTNNIPLYDDVGVVMKYPTYDLINDIKGIEDETQMMTETILGSVDYIYTKDTIHYASDYSKEELAGFFDDLEGEEFKKVSKFFNTSPKLTHTVEYKCPECGKQHKQTVEGIKSFF